MPAVPLPLLLPLLAAVVYVTGALLLRRAAQGGADAWRMTWAANLVSAVVFSPLLLLGGAPQPPALWWRPAVAALLFLLGQVLTFRALQAGDVSVATPVLGIKVILVALLTALLLRDPLTPALWTAAALGSAAVALLNFTRGGARHHVGLTVVLSGLAAASYALFDVLVQKWSPAWGVGRFLPVMMGFVAAYSLLLRFIPGTRGRGTPRAALPWMLPGATCLAVQGLMFVSAVALYGQATVANVLYSSRGLWSVLAVWLVGHWFGNRERHLGARVLAPRLCGAALLTLAVVLVLLDRGTPPATPPAEPPAARRPAAVSPAELAGRQAPPVRPGP